MILSTNPPQHRILEMEKAVDIQLPKIKINFLVSSLFFLFRDTY